MMLGQGSEPRSPDSAAIHSEQAPRDEKPSPSPLGPSPSSPSPGSETPSPPPVHGVPHSPAPSSPGMPFPPSLSSSPSGVPSWAPSSTGSSSVSTTVLVEQQVVVDEQLQALINQLGDGNQLRDGIQVGGVRFTGYKGDAAHDVMGPTPSPTSPFGVSAGHHFG